MNLRESMPITAARIDSLREAFGKSDIDQRIKQGMNGAPGAFWAQESGNAVGTKARPALIEISAADMVIETMTRKPAKP